MGSSGSGRFPDYPGGRTNQPRDGDGGNEGGGPDPCAQSIANISLEEVGTAEFFQRHGRLPAVGAPVVLRRNLVGGRLAVESEDGLVIGLMPTAHNALRSCMERGFRYTGNVTSSTTRPVPRVRIDLAPEA